MTSRRTTEERYLSALRTSNLGVNPDASCDADSLLAAAYAARGDARRMLALDVYKVLSDPDMRGALSVAERVAGWIKRRSLKERGGEIIPRVKAIDMAMRLLKLWHRRTCAECSGRGHPLLNGAPVLDETRDCEECRGTGLIPIERLVQAEHAEIARALEREILGLCAVVMNDMRRLMLNEVIS